MKTPVFDANATGGKNLGPLPEWDLTDLYAAPDAPEFARDLDWLDAPNAPPSPPTTRASSPRSTPPASSTRSGATSASTPSPAGSCSYAGLRYYQNTTDPDRAKFFGDTQDRITDLHDAARLLHARAQPDRRRPPRRAASPRTPTSPATSPSSTASAR